MGVLSNNLKPSFLGLLKFLNNMNWYIVFFSLINLSVCIYEDQIGKFDWRQTYVGRIKFAQFDTVSTAKKIIVATEENVLAALNLKTGQVVWRHVFESSSAGNIQLLHVAEKVTTVTGSNPYLVRGWDASTGVLLWEWSLSLQDDERAEYSEWFVQQGLLVHVLPVFGSHLEVTMYNLMTGLNRGASSKLPAVWNNEGCVLTPPYYTCVSGSVGNQLLLSLDLTSNAVQIISKPLSEYINLSNSIGGDLRPLDGNNVVPGFIIDEKKILLLKQNSFEMLSVEIADQLASATVIDGANGPMLLQTWMDSDKGFSLTAHSTETGKVISEIWCSDPALTIPEPEFLAVMCSKNVREQHACRIFVNGADKAVHLMQQGGRVLWTREEALANVVAAEFIDLPVSDTEAELESEFGQKEGSVWTAFTRRLHTQYHQLMNIVKGFQGEDAAKHSSVTLVRDYFDLHKVLVLVTDVGKMFGMDNLTGELLWRRFLPGLNAESLVLLPRRAARSSSADAYVTVVAKHEETGNGYIVSLNPITGALVGEGVLQLDARVLQCAVLPAADADKLHALLLLDEDESVQVLPFSAASLVQNMYMYVAEKETGKVQGYALRYNGKEVVAQRTWSVQLGGPGPARIAAVAGRSQHEQVRSPGRAMPDRSVLYKYSNPNLVLFVLDKPDPTHKDVVVGVALDVVSGAVVAAAAHRRARALPLAVHADNCLAYLYRSDKHRRVEIATMELYEGKDRWSNPGEAFSSWRETRDAVVERQAYVLPAAADAAATTSTRRALAARHVLLALTTGTIVEIPWAFLEPRRPLGAGEAREEGALPYVPELPLPAEAAVNYNRSLQRARAVYTAPAGLESTSLVLATGLDLFYTRVAPSKTFDLLNDDFDYSLIALVLAALVAASAACKHFAARKALRLAWK